MKKEEQKHGILKKVLIIAYYWPPAGGGGVQRWVKFVKYLRDYGWEPIVFIPENANYPVLDQTLHSDIPEDIQIWKLPVMEPYDLYNILTGKKRKEKIHPNFLSEGKKLGWKDKIAVWIRGNVFIPDARFLWIRPASRYLIKRLREVHVDAIISTGPPHSMHLIAQKVHDALKIPWVVDYRDPWTQIDYFNDLHLTTLARNTHLRLEKKVLNSCNHIVTVGKSMAEDLNHFSKVPKTVITNGYDDADFTAIQGNSSTELNITYLGVMNESRNPHAFWQAIAAIRAKNTIHPRELRIHIVGQIDVTTEQSIREAGIDEMVIRHGYVSHSRALELMSQAGMLLLVINRTSNNKTILTGKIFEYIASGKPILCIGPKDGDAADILSEVESAHVFEYDETEAIENFVTDSYRSFRNGTLISNDVNKSSKYTRKNLTEKLATVLNQITE